MDVCQDTPFNMDQDGDSDSSCTITNDAPASPGMIVETSSSQQNERQIWAADFLNTISAENRAAIREEILCEENIIEAPTFLPAQEGQNWPTDHEHWMDAHREHGRLVDNDFYISPYAPVGETIDGTESEELNGDPPINLDDENYGLDDEPPLPPLPEMGPSQAPAWEPTPTENLWNLNSAECCMLLSTIDPLQATTLTSSPNLAVQKAHSIVRQTSDAIKAGLEALIMVAKLGEGINKRDENHLVTSCTRAPDDVVQIMEKALENMVLELALGDRKGWVTASDGSAYVHSWQRD
jgi:hypothetical protein